MLRELSDFRNLFIASAISHIGDGIALLALLLYVKQTRDSGPAVGALLLAQTIPRILGPVAGALADRIDRRQIMIVCDLARAAIFMFLAIELPSLPVLLAVVFFVALLDTAFTPASRSALPAFVPTDRLQEANAWMGATLNVQVAVGPFIGGILVLLLKVQGALIVNAATFAASAVFLAALPRLPPEPTEGIRPGLWQGVGEGFAFCRRHPVARAVVLTLFLGVAFGSLDNVALVFLARDVFGTSALGFGVVNSAFGVGMTLASVLLIRSGAKMRTISLFLVGWLLTGIGTLLTGLAPALGIAVAVQALAGVGNAADNVASDTLLQRSVPAAMLGRVFGLANTAVFVGAGLAYAAGGWLLEATSPRVVFTIAGAGVLAILPLSYLMLAHETVSTS
jgi:MFS family permease